MQIFISWSGDLSNKVAEMFSRWIKCVLQAVRPWVSSEMDRGVDWFTRINSILAETGIGVVFLTTENINSPWILFESGSLSNGLATKKVCTFLIDLKPTDIAPPLSQFNHTEPSETGLKKLVSTINNCLDVPLTNDTLNQVYNTYYPQFEKEYNEIIAEFAHRQVLPLVEQNQRSETDVLEEVLLTVRSLDKRMNFLESQKNYNNSIRNERNRAFSLNDLEHKIVSRYGSLLTNITKNDAVSEFELDHIIQIISEELDIPKVIARRVVKSIINDLD